METKSLKGKKFYVLDDGYVCLMDVMGDDKAIVQAAKISYGKKEIGSKADVRRIIRNLMRWGHTSPFEMVELKFLIKTPMYVWRQWIRHRTANVLERSTRYSQALEEMHMTRPGEWRSKEELTEETRQELTKLEYSVLSLNQDMYKYRLGLGIEKEQARKDLPLSTYTEAYWKIDLHNLLHFLELRMSDAAQSEIRRYAKIIGYGIVAELFPITWEAFLDYRINNMKLSAQEIELLNKINSGNLDINSIDQLLNQRLSKSESEEFKRKLDKLGYLGKENKE